MNLSNTIYDTLKNKIIQTLATLKLRLLPTPEEKKHAGRPLALKIIDILTLGVFRAEHGIETKKDLHNLFDPACSYKTLVVNLNRFAVTIMLLCVRMANENRRVAHVLKYTDSTDVPVCLVKNAKRHKTMRQIARWGKTRKGWFYGLKWHLTVDFHRRVLSFTFTPGNRDDRSQFMRLNELLAGVFVADAGYVSYKLAHDFYREGVRILFTKPLRKMKKLATKAQNDLYSSRARIETVFRHLKMFEGFVSSLPRSVDGYLANYFYALAAFMLNGVEQNPRLLN
jgi:hypothetical protein